VPAVEHAVIAAAGFGSRLGRGLPKCLVDFRGRTLLDRQLELLTGVRDVRLVVGFREREVMAHALALRPDLTIVRNPAYASTTTLRSYALGARYLRRPCLFMDADIVFEPASFAAFLQEAAQVAASSSSPLSRPLIGYTDAKTQDAVYVSVVDETIRAFDRQRPTPHEWANLALLPPAYCEKGSGAVYERLSGDLPLPGAYVDSYEIDRPADLEVAEAHYGRALPERTPAIPMPRSEPTGSPVSPH
jgi:GTP:adenosylcobinamide-phosphate guanylyltransferase